MPRALLEPNRVFYCFSDCGVCVGYCPVAAQDPSFSPRRIVMKSLLGDVEGLLAGQDIWRCRSCGRCAYHCPAGVDFLALIQELRTRALELKGESAAAENPAKNQGEDQGASPGAGQGADDEHR